MIVVIHTIGYVNKILRTTIPLPPIHPLMMLGTCQPSQKDIKGKRDRNRTDMTPPCLPEAKAIQQEISGVLASAWAGNAAVMGEIEFL